MRRKVEMRPAGEKTASLHCYIEKALVTKLKTRAHRETKTVTTLVEEILDAALRPKPAVHGEIRQGFNVASSRETEELASYIGREKAEAKK